MNEIADVECTAHTQKKHASSHQFEYEYETNLFDSIVYSIDYRFVEVPMLGIY